MRRRVQGEDARCSVPWAGHGPTPHEPWPARPREGRAGGISAPRPGTPNLAIRRRPREDWRPLCGVASPLDGLGQTNIRSLRRRRRARAARQAPRQAPPHAPEALAGPGRDPPARTPPVEAARSPRRRFRHRFQGSGRAREPPPPAKFPQKRTPQARTKAPFPRRERTAPLGRRTRRRAGLPNPSSRRRNEARAASRPRRAAIPVTGPPLSGSPFAAWTTPTEPGARGPMPGERFTPADDPALSRDK